MQTRELTLRVSESVGEVATLLQRPRDARWLLVLAHGAMKRTASCRGLIAIFCRITSGTSCTAHLREVLFLDSGFDDLRNKGHEKTHGFLNFLITVPEAFHHRLNITTCGEKV